MYCLEIQISFILLYPKGRRSLIAKLRQFRAEHFYRDFKNIQKDASAALSDKISSSTESLEAYFTDGANTIQPK